MRATEVLTLLHHLVVVVSLILETLLMTMVYLPMTLRLNQMMEM